MAVGHDLRRRWVEFRIPCDVAAVDLLDCHAKAPVSGEQLPDSWPSHAAACRVGMGGLAMMRSCIVCVSVAVVPLAMSRMALWFTP